MKDKIMIELCSENKLGSTPFYSVLELPATAEQIRDARQRARIVSGADATYQSIRMLYFDPLPDLEHIRLDTTSVEELNYLSKRLESLSDQQFIIYQALFDQRFGNVDSDELLTVKDLINMTYGLDGVMIAANIHNDEQLGQFVIENDLHPDVAAVPEGSLYLLDKRRIGELQRKSDDGILFDGFYVVAGEYEIPDVYDGRSIPAVEDGVFRLKVGSAEADTDGEWLVLPVVREEADAKAKDAFGANSIADCVCVDFESGIPQITAAAVRDMANFDALNALAIRYLGMSEEEQIKFKAILEAEDVAGVNGALAAAGRLNEYEFSCFDSDADSFFKTHLLHSLDARFDPRWLNTVEARDEGKKLLKRIGASVTEYGVISARGGHLFKPVSVDAPMAKELKTHTMPDEKLEVIEVLGRTALFTDGRIAASELPKGLYKYELRNGTGVEFASIEPSVPVDFSGSVITKEPINFGCDGYIELDEYTEPFFCEERMSIDEFLNTSLEQTDGETEEACDETENMGGMIKL